MAGGAADSNERTLDHTPTWAVAAVVVVIILVSIILEKSLHRLGKWFTKKHKDGLFEALERVKGELMVLGFISLILTFTQSYIPKICVPHNVANTMLPCPLGDSKDIEDENRRGLLWNSHRLLAAGSVGSSFCTEKRKTSLVSNNGLHQLHRFIFFLAVIHVAYSVVTMTLGRMKIRTWKGWEQEALSQDHEVSNDHARFRLTHETSFVRGQTSFCTSIPLFFYIVSFFRQFFRSVRQADYLTMRHGFIAVHLAPGTKFNFQKYIKRSLEDDFKVVVGISPFLWFTLVLFLLLNVHAWKSLLWASIIPPLVILAVGTKLQAIITQMAVDIQEKNAVVLGIPLVQVSDRYFWFSSPRLMLYLIHFTLFQNAFQITYFLWILYEFPRDSCFRQKSNLVLICVGVFVQILTSYITLPLYALVTQMGSHMKKTIFDEQTSRALMNWHKAIVKKKKDKKTERTIKITPIASQMQSPAFTLQRFKTTGHSAPIAMASKKYKDIDLSEAEGENHPTSSTAVLLEHMERSDVEAGNVELTYATQEQELTATDEFEFQRPDPLSRP